MDRPSRGDRESAATTRYVGCFFLPIRMRRSLTATAVFFRVSGVTRPRGGGVTRRPTAERPTMMRCARPSEQTARRGPDLHAVDPPQRARLAGGGARGAGPRPAPAL